MALFVISLPLVTPRLYASDEIEYFAYLRSMWFDRDLSFENEYRYFYDHGVAKNAAFHDTFLGDRFTATGLRLNFAPVGCALLWAPFYAVADVTARALHAMGYPVAVDGYSAPYVRAVTFASAVYGFLALLLSLAAVRRVCRRAPIGSDPLAALAVWWGTPLVFYMYVAPPMSHAPSAFTVAAFVLAWLHVRDRWTVRGLALLGALAALMTEVREQDAFFVVGPAVDLLWALLRERRSGTVPVPRIAIGLAAGAAWFALVYLPQALAYLSLNGRLGVPHEVSRKMTWSAPHALQVLASPEHGFLFWTPLAALAIVGLGLLLRGGTSRIGACLIAMVAAQVYIAGSVESWTVAGAFGQRRFVGLTPVLVIGLASLFALAATRRWRIPVAAVTAVAVWWNIGLMVQFGSGLMDRQRLDLGPITYNNFIAVPARLPELAYRYMFARSSFYRAPATAPDPGR